MDKIQRVILILVLIALVFSSFSLYLNVSVSSDSFRQSYCSQYFGSNFGSQAGNVGLTIESSNPNNSGEIK